MRNLKKVLSLALAMVMLLGMMVIGAGAVETQFADNDKVGETYKEAVAVMTEVGVINGKENNNFDPEGTLTRAEAATILVRVTMGTEAAKGLAGVTKSGVFTDMSNHWAAGYVDACFNKGIVGGIGNSLYAPDSKLTGTQFAAMLMRAAGVEGDFTGSSWESAVIAAAAKAKLSEVTTGEISRQAAAKMAFDGILYSPSGEKAYKVGDLSFDNFLEAYIANGSKTEGITVSTASDSLAKTVLGLTETTKNDAFGNPQKVWQVDGKDKVTVPGVKADKTYTEKKSSLTDDLKGYSFKDAKKIEDGVETTISNSTDAAAVAKTIADLTGNGVEVSVYANNKVISKVVVVNPYVGEVTRVTEAKGDDKRSVTVGGLKFETEDFAKGDVVIYTKTKGDTETIRSMYQPNLVEGVTVTRKTGTTSFVADGETYKYAALGSGAPTNPTLNNVVDVYLDQYGFAAKVEINKGYSDYAYVAAIDTKTSYGVTTKYARLVMTDGTMLEDVVYTGTVAAGDIVKFTKDAKDAYTLFDATNKLTGKVVINNGKTGMALSSSTVNTYANNKTLFLVQNKTSKEWSAYTGYANVPSIEIANGDYTVVKTGTLASVVVVPNAPLSSNTSLFVLKVTSPEQIRDEDGTYYVYPAVVDGEITTVKLDGTIGESGLYDTVIYANDGAQIIDISECALNATTKVTGTVSEAFDEGIIKFTSPSATKSVSADVEVYKLGTTAISSSSIEEIKVGDTVTAIEKDGELISVFYTAKGTNTGNIDKIDVSDVEVDSSEWNASARDEAHAIVIDTLKFKSTVSTSEYLKKAEAAVAAKVVAEKGWTYTNECALNNAADHYVLEFKDRNDTLRYVKFAKTLVEAANAHTVVDADTAAKFTEALGKTNVEIVVNGDLTVTDTTINKPVEIAKGATLTVSTGATVTKVTGEGTVKLASGTATITEIDPKATVEVGSAATVTLTGNSDGNAAHDSALPNLKGNGTITITDKLGTNGPAGDPDALNELETKASNETTRTVDGSKYTYTIDKANTVKFSGAGSLNCYDRTVTIDSLLGRTGSAGGSNKVVFITLDCTDLGGKDVTVQYKKDATTAAYNDTDSDGSTTWTIDSDGETIIIPVGSDVDNIILTVQ